MQTALAVLLVCAAIDVILCAILLAVVWTQHRKLRAELAAVGEPLPSAAGQFGCLFGFCFIGLIVVYGTAWLLLRSE